LQNTFGELGKELVEFLNNSYSQFRTQKHLKRAKHVHVHVIQHPTKFQRKTKKI